MLPTQQLTAEPRARGAASAPLLAAQVPAHAGLSPALRRGASFRLSQDTGVQPDGPRSVPPLAAARHKVFAAIHTSLSSPQTFPYSLA